MDVTVNTGDFLRELTAAMPALQRKSELPVLHSVELEASGNSLTVTATNLSLTIRASLDAQVWSEGRAVIPAERFAAYVGLLPGSSNISLRSIDTNHWIAVRCGRSTAKIPGLNPDNWPRVPEPVDALEIGTAPAAIVAQAFERALSAIGRRSQPESQWRLECAQLDVLDGRARIMATNGIRLCLAGFTLDADVSERSILLPKKLLKSFGAFIEGLPEMASASIRVNDKCVFIETRTRQMIAYREFGPMPAYQRVLAESGGNIRTVVDCEELAKALSRAHLFADELTDAVTITCDQAGITVSSGNADLGETLETIESGHVGDPVTIRFAASHLQAFLAHAGTPRTTISLRDLEHSAKLTPAGDGDNFEYAVMPMRS